MNKSPKIEEHNFQRTLATLGVYALEQDDLDMILHRAIQQCCAVLNLNCAAILILDEEKDTLEVASETGCGCEELEIENNKKWDIGYTFQSKKPVRVLDYGDEKRFSISPMMAKKGFVSSVHIALRGSEKMFGVLALYSNKKREFPKQDMHFIQAVANILGRSIEQKQVKKELQEANALLQREMSRSLNYQKEILNKSMLDRWELGGYLHDNLAQLLASAKILIDDIILKMKNSNIDITSETDELIEIMDASILGIRDIVHEIIPIDIEKEGVAKAFRLLMNQTYRLYDVNCTLTNHAILNEIKNREIATHLYHIVQETLKNAAIHGKATNITVSIAKTNTVLILTMKDDGVDFDPEKKYKGKGIRIMKHRMDLMGGTLDIHRNTGTDEYGTVVICTLPLKNLERGAKPE